MTARTQSERINRERLRVIAIAAAEQSERLSLPEIRPEVPLTRLLADWPADRRLVLCDESGAGQPIAEALARVRAGRPRPRCLSARKAVFAETELDALGKLSIVTRVGLGPRILRAETAALAALAVYQAVAGDWRLAPRALSAGSPFITIGSFGSRMSGPSSLQGPPITDKRQLIEYHETRRQAAERVAHRHRARKIRVPARRSEARAL